MNYRHRKSRSGPRTLSMIRKFSVEQNGASTMRPHSKFMDYAGVVSCALCYVFLVPWPQPANDISLKFQDEDAIYGTTCAEYVYCHRLRPDSKLVQNGRPRLPHSSKID